MEHIEPRQSAPMGGGAELGGNSRMGWFWTILRILLGWTLMWAFLDKFFGLGFNTCRLDTGNIDFACDAAFINGGSPTYGFLTFGTNGSALGSWFDWMASSGPDAINFTDVLFLLVLLLGGIALMLGVGVRLAAIGGALLLFFMYLAGYVWPTNNPFVDNHLIEVVLYLGVAMVGPSRFALQGWVDRNIPALSWLR